MEEKIERAFPVSCCNRDVTYKDKDYIVREWLSKRRIYIVGERNATNPTIAYIVSKYGCLIRVYKRGKHELNVVRKILRDKCFIVEEVYNDNSRKRLYRNLLLVNKNLEKNR